MADPVVTPDTTSDITNAGEAASKSSEQIAHLAGAAVDASTSFDGWGKSISSANNILNGITSSLRGLGISLKETKSLTEQQRDQFTLISGAMINARKSFEGLSAGVDTTGLSTFTDQYQELLHTLDKGESLTGAALDSVVNEMKKLGKSNAEIQAAVDGGSGALFAFAKNAFTSADNALRLQNAVVQLAGKTGNLDAVFQMAGPHLENINALLAKHETVILDANAATGVSTAQVEKYWSQLGMVPKALESLVTGAGNADTKVSMLTATMKVAAGQGRAYEDVVDDLKTAFKNYGIVGESALKFSAQMGEISNNLGVELGTVKDALKETSDVFKMFATNQREATAMSGGFATILNNYTAALERTGFSGTQAVSVIKNMIGSMSNLSIAQKSFLSAQSGGPGGLMGGFQIEKMMKEDPAKVMDMVRNNLKKQFGSIVSLDDATKSEGAARQREKQLLTVQQGPLGSLAKTPEEAGRLLSALDELDKGGNAKLLSDKIVQQSMDKGTSIQEKSYSVATELNHTVEAIRAEMNTGFLSLVQKGGLTAGSGAGQHDGDASPVATHLKGTMTAAGAMQRDRIADSLATTTENKKLIDTSGRSAAAALTNLGKTISIIPDALKAPIEILKKSFSSQGKGISEEERAKAREELQNDVNRRRMNMSKIPIDKRSSAMSEISAEEDAIKKLDIYQSMISKNAGKDLNKGKVNPPGTQVGAAAGRASATRGGMVPTGGTTGSTGIPAQVTSTGNKSELTVHVTGFCLKCKQEIEGGSHAKATNKASTAT